MDMPDDILFVVLDQLESPCQTPCAVWNEPKIFWQTLIAFSVTSKRMRSLAAPKLFKRVILGPSWSVDRLSTVLSTIQSRTDVFRYTKDFRIDLWPDRNETRTCVVRRNSRDQAVVLAKRLTELLSSMIRLERLEMTMAIGVAMSMSTVFKHNAALFPQIKELVLSPDLHWMIAMCPAATTVKANDWTASHDVEYAFLEAAAAARNLKHFSMHCSWNEEMITRVIEKMPQLRTLGLPGCISGDLWRRPDYYFQMLVKFKFLERLELVDAQKLVAGLVPIDPWFRYRPLDGEHLYGMTTDQEMVTRCVLKRLPGLRELCLGRRFTARMVRSDSKVSQIRWEVTVFSHDMAEHVHELAYRHGIMTRGPTTLLSLASM